MRTVLDDRKAISSFDTKDMLGAVERFPEFITSQLRAQPPVGRKSKRLAISNIVFMGMGGSASAGDFGLDWVSYKNSVPAVGYPDPVPSGFLGSSNPFLCAIH